MPKLTFDKSTHLPTLQGKVILITGGTAGLGRESVLSFAAHSKAAHIFFTGRSQTSADSVLTATAAKNNLSSTPITFIPCDLSSLAAVQDAARAITAQTDRLDIVLANAGIMAVAPALTKDGYEVQFGTNHLGHALLIKLLTPLLIHTASQPQADVRIVWNSSQGYALHPKQGIVFDGLKTPQQDIAPVGGSWVRYGQAKLANLLYARAFAAHHPTITSVAIHPGVSATGLVTGLGFWSKVLVYATTAGKMISPEECAFNQQWAATARLGSASGNAKGEVVSGRYYEPVGVETAVKGKGADEGLVEELWRWTQKELEGFGL